jgi:hypothetical protein
VALFAQDELGVLVDKLDQDLGFTATAPDLVGALILAARRLPVEVVRELMPAYKRRERQVVEGTSTETP